MFSCIKCERKHDGKCLVGIDDCFSCTKNFIKMKDYPMLQPKVREDKQVLLSGFGSNAPKKNLFYELKTYGEEEDSLDLVFSMLNVF